MGESLGEGEWLRCLLSSISRELDLFPNFFRFTDWDEEESVGLLGAERYSKSISLHCIHISILVKINKLILKLIFCDGITDCSLPDRANSPALLWSVA